MKKKLTAFDVVFYGGIILAVALVGAVIGHQAGLSVVDGNISYPLLLEKLTAIDGKGALVSLKALAGEDNTYPLYGFFGGAFVALVGILYVSGNKKKYNHKGEEHGSARWATESEKRSLCDPNDNDNNVVVAKDVYLVLDRKKRDENNPKKRHKPNKKPLRPVGVEKNITKLVINKSKKSSIQTMLSLNTMIFGGTGCGKSRFYAIPNLLQCNCSFVITDPSGELLQKCGYSLKKNGYKIKVFNLMDLANSNNYNPFAYVDYEHPNRMESDIRMIAETFMNCTRDKDGKSSSASSDPFWESSATALLMAACYLLAEEFPPEERTLSKALEITTLEKCEEGKESELSLFDGLFIERRKVSPRSISLKYYDQYKQGGAKTKQSVLATLNSHMQDFNIREMADLTALDNIELEKLGDEKTALFIIIPTMEGKYNWLASMMYSQLFSALYRRAQGKYAYRNNRLPVHVRFMLDEFANTGRIPDFEKALATIRKYEISATIILQNLTQLKNMYEKSWSDLVGNCDTKIFLGGEDLETNKYFVELLGKETINTLSINKTKSKQGSTSYNDGILGRDLMTADEFGKLPNSDCIVKIRGMSPIRTLKHELYYHPRYKELAMEDGSTPDMVFDITTVHTERVIEVTETLAEIADGVADEALEISFILNENAIEDEPDEVILSDIFFGMNAVYTTAA
jgi:type IV secretion system protein VirD4